MRQILHLQVKTVRPKRSDIETAHNGAGIYESHLKDRLDTTAYNYGANTRDKMQNLPTNPLRVSFMVSYDLRLV